MGKTLVAIAAAVALSLVVTSASQAQQQQQQGKGKGGGRGRGKAAPPAGPTPRTPDGKVILGGETPGKNGVWTPQIGITEPAAKLENVPFLPWAKAVYDNRQKNELEPHTRCKPSGVARQFMTPYGVEIFGTPGTRAAVHFRYRRAAHVPHGLYGRSRASGQSDLRTITAIPSDGGKATRW